MRIGIIGCGKVAPLHAQALRGIPETRLTSAFDADPSRALSFAAKYGATAFNQLRPMLATVDVAIVCTPHPLHLEAVLAAADAGVSVLVEKPLASTLIDCDRMIEAAERAGITLGVVSQRRFVGPVQRMKRAIEEGKIGAPVLGTMMMLSWRDEAYYRSDPWRGTWKGEGGGVLINQSPHQLDILLWLMGPLAEVSAVWGNVNHPYIEVEDTAVASLRFHSGALGSITTSVSQKPGIYTKVHVHGSNGYSVGVQTDTGATFVAGMSGIAEPPFNDVWTVPGEEACLEQWKAEDRERLGGLDMTVHYHRLQLENFLQALHERREPLVTARDGRAVVALVDAIYRSWNERRYISLPISAV